MTSRLLSLEAAVGLHVEPGMHLHFASTPSRSNAAILEIARAYLGTSPGFCVSTSGFHSTAHVFGLLGLVRRCISCFYGDNWPVPRPNALYTRLARAGVELEHWSLATYVTALRAAAMGHAYGVTRSLAGTTLGAELAALGRYVELPAPSGERVGLVGAMHPDIAFLHAAAGDEDGNILSSAPYGEGLWSATAARRGAIVTVERLLPRDVVAAHPAALRIPRHRVLAVCVAPRGAHPQPLFVPRELGGGGYRDDLAHYESWRTLCEAPARLADFVEGVLRAPAHAYATYVENLREQPAARRASEPIQDVAARVIAERVRTRGYRTILAGLGQPFYAARIAARALHADGIDVSVMVETGLVDVDCAADGHDFLLSHDHIARAGRRGAVEDVLGTLTCGHDNRCLGVLGAAQIDARGAINTTRLADGRILVGSGGANDIASCAAEVIAIAACAPDRFVREVDYVTSPGHRVGAIVTERCVLERGDRGFELREIIPGPNESRDAARAAIRAAIPWTLPEGA